MRNLPPIQFILKRLLPFLFFALAAWAKQDYRQRQKRPEELRLDKFNSGRFQFKTKRSQLTALLLWVSARLRQKGGETGSPDGC